MAKSIINTKHAPQAIGTYSQAVVVNDLVFLSGQIAINPLTGELISGNIIQQTEQIFKNIEAVALAAGITLQHIVRLGVYLTNLNDFDAVNQTMKEIISLPYPARSLIEVSALPKQADIEIDAIMALNI